MNFPRVFEQQVFDQLLKLNQRFHSGIFNLQGLSELLLQHGYDYRRCVLAEVVPDDENCLVGLLIGPGRQLLEFELHPDDLPGSTVTSAAVFSSWQQPNAAVARSPRWMAWRYYDKILIEVKPSPTSSDS